MPLGLNLLKIVKQPVSGITIEIKKIMKAINDRARQLKTHLLEWVLIKGPELFVTIYGK
jgi:hypothetical protein